MLTPRQLAAHEFIAGFLADHGFAPSYEEIRRHLGVRSLNSVAKLIAQLRRRGALLPAPPNAKRRLALPAHRELPRSLRRLLPPRVSVPPRGPEPSGVLLLGVIAAGRPIEAVENPEPIDVPAALRGTGERYALRVRGDSMIEDGIRDGDLIVVRRTRQAESGETVVAIVDGEATLKRFYRRGAEVELHPANAALRPIRVSADRVEIRGVLAGLIRRYA